MDTLKKVSLVIIIALFTNLKASQQDEIIIARCLGPYLWISKTTKPSYHNPSVMINLYTIWRRLEDEEYATPLRNHFDQNHAAKAYQNATRMDALKVHRQSRDKKVN